MIILTGFGYLSVAPVIYPLLAADRDSWFVIDIACGWNGGDRPPKDWKGNEEAVFCFLRKAGSEGRVIESWTARLVVRITG